MAIIKGDFDEFHFCEPKKEKIEFIGENLIIYITIKLGKLVVFFQDECHLLWVDICGYVWGKKNERIEVPIVNEKERQTYLGAVNTATAQCLLQAYTKGNKEHTIEYLKYLMS